mmetsp:Transcript_16460/g.39324  ORF Transcript_16460/g.39324 Transcript_16460/m.39324 type:complete len:669 (-) Transcript_16460:236-2242(-)
MASSSALRMPGYALLVFVAVLAQTEGFYLPGVAPRAFKDGEAVNMKVQTLVSTETPLQFDYYQLPFCEPGQIKDLPENLGEALAGEKAHTSAFDARMKVDEYCKTLCRKKYSPQQMEEFQDFAILEYRVNMRLDNLPIAEMTTIAWDNDMSKTEQYYNLGYPIGAKLQPEGAAKQETDLYVLNNHLRFRIKYHPVNSGDLTFTEDETVADAGSYIVGFEVIPFSIKHTYWGKFNESAGAYARLSTCSQPPDGRFEKHQPQVIDPTEGGEVIWTYDVVFEPSPIKWSTRWDTYLQSADDAQVHWFSILNSFMIVVFLSGLIAMIMIRTLRKDFQRYERGETLEEGQEETGWKLVHGDVFRTPPRAAWLAVLIGTGTQLCVSCAILLVFACLGFLSPANRGALMQATLFLFVFMGMFGGYTAARFFRMFKGTAWRANALWTAMLFPGTCFGVFFVVNLLIWGQKSSGAVPFTTLLAMLLMWLCISVPLVLVGAFFGYRMQPIEHPVRVNQIPRQVPEESPLVGNAIRNILVGGILPFGAVFVEVFYVLSSIWQHQIYYLFGILFLVLVILLLTCSEVTIVMCYFQLCSEDYHWWWRAYFTAGTSAVYFFLYAGYYVMTRMNGMETAWVSGCIFFGYIAGLSYAFFVLTGFTGFISCFFFVRCIYASIKVD